jgi:acetyl-CoA carboxylase/biotin carboxylase 1
VSPSDCTLHGRRLLQPYPALEPLQIKRLAARRHNTTYCYDFPTVFENALRDIWWAPKFAWAVLWL